MSVLQEIKVLKEIANDDYATVVMAHFKNKDKVKEGDALIELETTKTTFVVHAEKEGYVEYLYKAGDEVSVGVVIIRIHDNPQDLIEGKEVLLSEKTSETKFSAAASELIKKEGLDALVFAGRDFVSAEDVQQFIKSKKVVISDKESFPLLAHGNVKVQKLNRAKLTEITSLSAVQSANMNSLVSVFVDTENIVSFARDHLDIFKDSILPFIIFEASRLLKKYPELNAFFVDNSIAFYNDVNIGLAVNLGQGLKVVKFVSSDQKSVKQIETEILDMANKYLDKTLTESDILGSTFTVTDLSQAGVHFFVPLINKQQSAILGVCAIDQKLNRCALTLTFDHRVSEGKQAGEFLNELKARLESYVGQSRLKENVGSDHLGVQCYKCLASLKEIQEIQGEGLFHMIDCQGKEQYICGICMDGGG